MLLFFKKRNIFDPSIVKKEIWAENLEYFLENHIKPVWHFFFYILLERNTLVS